MTQGVAYTGDGVFSEIHLTHGATRSASRRAAREKRCETTGLSWEEYKGSHEEIALGDDRPMTDVHG